MSRGRRDGSRSDPKRRFFENVEGLLDGDASNAVFFEQHLNALSLEVWAAVGLKEQLEELTEKRVYGTMTRGKGQQVWPTFYEQIADLRTQSDMVLDELFSNAQELSQGDDLGRRQAQSLKPMAVFSECIS
jgi:hypothetical protein